MANLYLAGPGGPGHYLYDATVGHLVRIQSVNAPVARLLAVCTFLLDGRRGFRHGICPGQLPIVNNLAQSV